MNYGEIKKYDIANGEGVRVSLLCPGAPITVRDALTRKPGIFLLEKNTHRRRKKRSLTQPRLDISRD